ncbi:MAG: DNA-processing protein DprA [Candidatus Poribacteria bacterium]|nr:DNA-processing protein DprA [Candidatus Poribacteria bacterium]
MKVKAPYFWMWLCKTHGIGPKKLASIAKILHEHQRQPETLPLNPTELLSQFPKLANILNGRIRVEDSQAICTEYLRLKDAGVTMLHPSHPNFPQHLLEISPILFIKGQHELLTSDSVAIVGARDVSDEGVRVAQTIAAGLAREGINVVSGYAKGVDSEAHFSALASDGTTTIVLPHGITGLRRKKAFRSFNWERNVLAVSQFAPDTKWVAHNAMTRNKLICALSKAVVVIESGSERNTKGKLSGTFNTGKTALEMKLPLFVADPEHFVHPPQGNADLIRLGGYKLNPHDGAGDILCCLKGTMPKTANDSVIDAEDESCIQMNFLTDFQTSTEASATSP